MPIISYLPLPDWLLCLARTRGNIPHSWRSLREKYSPVFPTFSRGERQKGKRGIAASEEKKEDTYCLRPRQGDVGLGTAEYSHNFGGPLEGMGMRGGGGMAEGLSPSVHSMFARSAEGVGRSCGGDPGSGGVPGPFRNPGFNLVRALGPRRDFSPRVDELRGLVSIVARDLRRSGEMV